MDASVIKSARVAKGAKGDKGAWIKRLFTRSHLKSSSFIVLYLSQIKKSD